MMLILMYVLTITIAYLSFEFFEYLVSKVYFEQISLHMRLNTIKKMRGVKYKEKTSKTKKDNSKKVGFQGLKQDLFAAGINLRVDEFTKIWISIVILPALLWFLIKQSIAASLGLAALGLVLPKIYIKMKIKKRKDLFNVQLGDALLIISNSLKSGFTFEQSLRSIAKDLPDPIGREFLTILREIELGDRLEDSMARVAERMNSKEMDLLNTAVSIQRKVGGNLSHIIDNIGKTIRDRIQLQKRIKALTAQGEISGKIIGVLPILLFFVILTINPEYMKPMVSTPFGYVAIAVSIFLEVMGFVVIGKIVRIET